MISALYPLQPQKPRFSNAALFQASEANDFKAYHDVKHTFYREDYLSRVKKPDRYKGDPCIAYMENHTEKGFSFRHNPTPKKGLAFESLMLTAKDNAHFHDWLITISQGATPRLVEINNLHGLPYDTKRSKRHTERFAFDFDLMLEFLQTHIPADQKRAFEAGHPCPSDLDTIYRKIVIKNGAVVKPSST